MKTAFELGWKALAVTAAALIGNMLIQSAVFAWLGDVWGWEDRPALSEMLLSMFAAKALTVAVLIFPTRYSTLEGVRLFGALFTAIFGINTILGLIEAAAWLSLTNAQLLSMAIPSPFSAAWLAFLMVKVFGSRQHQVTKSQIAMRGLVTRRWLGLLSIAAACYVALYFSAGMLIYPNVMEFYETQNFSADLSTALWTLPLQLLRGALYVLFVIWLLRTIYAPRWQICLAMGLMFPVLAGAAALWLPNPIMPEDVRHWHSLEVGWSNFVYGVLVAYLFSRPSAEKETEIESGDDLVATQS